MGEGSKMRPRKKQWEEKIGVIYARLCQQLRSMTKSAFQVKKTGQLSQLCREEHTLLTEEAVKLYKDQTGGSAKTEYWLVEGMGKLSNYQLQLGWQGSSCRKEWAEIEVTEKRATKSTNANIFERVWIGRFMNPSLLTMEFCLNWQDDIFYCTAFAFPFALLAIPSVSNQASLFQRSFCWSLLISAPSITLTLLNMLWSLL